MTNEVKFGLRVPEFPLDGSQGTDFTDQIAGFLEKFEGKFDSAWVCDHFFPWSWWIRDPKTTDNLECMTSLSYLAGRFPAYHFGSIVLCNGYRNPALLAQMGATLQAFSGGRFILGIGAGWKEDEYRAHGFEFPPTPIRIKQLEEAVQIIRRMWMEDDPSFEGEHHTIEHAYCRPRPDPPPPIMIGGAGEKLTLRVVAKYADWWNLPDAEIERFRHKREVLKRHCDEIGRDFDEIVLSAEVEMVAIAKTEAEADRLARETPFSSRGSEDAQVGAADQPMPPDVFNEGIIGTPAQVTEAFKQYTDLGVTYFIVRFADRFPETRGAELFAEQVIPNFR
jgi:alkanesulfonate monooxygenase SsuD/methylene tetrahydromethanopterin reductase-like flavin-dependent oxidoreductase (luciferase family)